MIKYNLYGDTNQLPIKLRSTIRKVLSIVAKEEDIKSTHIVSFIIVSNDEIHFVNKKYRNIDRPTDVISFATIDGNQDRTLSYQLGDIYISYEKVLEQSISYNHSITREFAFLVTHGMLHLLGYDHMNEKDEEIMFNKQEEILNKANILRNGD